MHHLLRTSVAYWLGAEIHLFDLFLWMPLHIRNHVLRQASNSRHLGAMVRDDAINEDNRIPLNGAFIRCTFATILNGFVFGELQFQTFNLNSLLTSSVVVSIIFLFAVPSFLCSVLSQLLQVFSSDWRSAYHCYFHRIIAVGFFAFFFHSRWLQFLVVWFSFDFGDEKIWLR